MAKLKTLLPLALTLAVAPPLAANEESGVEYEFAYTGEYWENQQGGAAQDSAYLDNVDLTLSLDTEKLFGLEGGTFFFYVLGNSGDDPTELSGDMQGVSNIAADETYKLYEAWYEQRFGDNAILFGLYDLNSEFDVIPSAGLFINSSHGIGPDFSQAGVTGPSIFPVTSLGLRYSTTLGEQGYLMAAVWDGVPGDPNNPMETQVRLDKNDGTLITIETGLVADSPNEDGIRPDSKLAVGVWKFSEAFPQLDDATVTHTNNQGLYMLAEYAVSREEGSPDQGLSVFARLGGANADINQVGQYFGTGLVYTGLLPGRDEDQIGLAIAMASNGDRYKAANPTADDSEINVEFTYSAIVSPWLMIQPDIQYIINPSTDPSVDDALVAGIRFAITM